MLAHLPLLAAPWARRAGLLLGAVALAIGLGVALGSRSEAEPGDAPHMVYISITGDGPSAKAWYDGSAPTGVSVQAALDTFSTRGYRLSALSEGRPRVDSNKDALTDSLVWLMVLERIPTR